MTLKKYSIARVTTSDISMDLLLIGQLKELSKNWDVTAISSPGERLVKVGNREGVKIFGVKMERQISLISDLISFFKLYLYFKKNPTTIAHSITPKAGLLTMLAAKLSGVPIRIHTFTGIIFPTKTGFLKKILILADKIICKSATNVYAEGIGVKNDLINYGITNKPIKILANGNINGIDCNYFDPKLITKEDKEKLRNSLNIKKTDFIFLFVGRLVKDKGIDELVKAFKSINNPSIKLLLVGPYEEHLSPLSFFTHEEIEKNDKIITTGFENDVRQYYGIANVFVFPSYREGFPNVLLQAGAMNLPCIATNINGCNEIIKNGINGLLIQPQNFKELKSKMTDLIENPSLCAELSKTSRQNIVEKFNNKIVWETLHKEYNFHISRHKIFKI